MSAAVTREELFLYAKETYGAQPDYPWAKTPRYAILRHEKNRKWFCALVEVTRDKLGLEGTGLIEALLLKCDPIMVGSLRSEPGILPAYHMNKEHWITVLMDGSCPKERVFDLMNLSFTLTK